MLTATGSNLLWSTGETTPTIFVSPIGTYTVTQTVGGCTSASGSAAANPTPIPSAPVVTINDGCGSTTLSATGSNLLWSTGETTASITVTTSGTYTVTQTVNGCASPNGSAAANPMAIPSAPIVTVTDGCGSSTLSATGSNLLWSTGETTSSITVATAGTYTVTQTVGACTSSNGSGTANPSTAPTITLSSNDPSVCGGTDGSIIVNGSGSGDVSWTGTATGASTGVTLPYTISGLTAGSYTVSLNDGCVSNSPSASLSDPSAPSVPTVTVTDGCGSTTLSATGSNLLWSTGETTASITVTTAGTYTVTQTVGGCTSSPATGNANPTAIPAAPTVTVTDGCGSTTLSATGSNLLWSTGETVSSITVSTAGAYTVTQTVGGCTSSPAIGASNPTAIPSAPTVTITDGCGSTTLSATGSNLLWSTGETTSSITVSTGGAYTVTQTVGGCTSLPATENATPQSIPSAPIVTVNDLCGYSELTATGSNLTWSTGETTSLITVTVGGTYYVAQSTGSCVSPSTSVTATPLLVPSAPVITASGSLTFCAGDSVQLSVSQSTGVTWSTGETTSMITVHNGGNYSVAYTATNGCQSSSVSTTTTVNPLPVVTLGAFTEVCESSAPFSLSGGAPGGGVYSGDGVSGGIFDPSVAGIGVHTISYTYTDGNSCSNSAQSDLTVSECLGITELELNGLSVYPNPVSEIVNISSKNYRLEIIELYDAAGRLVMHLRPNEMESIINIADLEPAMYHLVITIENGLDFRTKLLKQ